MSAAAIAVGGFCEMFELCRRSGVELVGVIDASPLCAAGYDVPYLGCDEVFLSDAQKYRGIPLIVVPDSPLVRRKIVARYRAAGFSFRSVISPDADVSASAQVGEGVVVQSHAVVTAQARLGAFVKLNIGATVFHESRIGDYATLAPRATVLGRVDVGACAYVGASSTVLPGVSVGERCTVGAGAVVTRNVADGEVVAGVPARKLERR